MSNYRYKGLLLAFFYLNSAFSMQKSIDQAQKCVNQNIDLIERIKNNDTQGAISAIYMGADIHKTDKNGWTPLELAIWEGQLEVVKNLLKAGANININIDSWGPLYLAAREEKETIFRYLLRSGADFNKKDWVIRSTIFEYATILRDKDLMRILLDKGDFQFNKNALEQTLFGFIFGQELKLNGLSRIEFLFQIGVDPNCHIESDKPLIIYACEKNNLDLIKILIKYKANLNCIYNGHTPLTIAVNTNNLKLVRLLVENEANIFYYKDNVKSAFEIAQEKRFDEILKLFVEQVTSWHTRLVRAFGDSNGNDFVKYYLKSKDYYTFYNFNLLDIAFSRRSDKLTILIFKADPDLFKSNNDFVRLFDEFKQNNPDSLIHKAIKEGNAQKVRILLSFNERIDQKDSEENTPLELAIKNNNLEIVKILVLAKVNLNFDNSNSGPVYLAAQLENKAIFKYLLENGARFDTKNWEVCYEIIKFGSKFLNKNLLVFILKNIDKNLNLKVLYKLICDLINETNLDLVNFILDIILDPILEKNLEEPFLLYATKNNNINLVKIICNNLAKKAFKNSVTEKPLILACEKGYKEIAESILNINPGLNIKNEDYDPLIIIASANGYKEIVELLLKAGAKIDERDSEGFTPVMCAAYNGHIETFELLLKSGADIKLINQANENALILSISKGCFKIVELLIKACSDLDYINSRNKRGETSLMIAARRGHRDIVDLLIKSGAQVNLQDKIGDTALMKIAQAKKQIGSQKDINSIFSENKHVDNLNVLNNQIEDSGFPLIDIENNDMQATFPDSFKVDLSQEFQEFNEDILGNNLYIANTNQDFINNDLELDILNFSENVNNEILEKNIDIVNLLIKAGADLNIKNQKDQTAYFKASEHNKELAEVLKNTIISYKEEIYKAIKENNYDTFKKYLLKVGTICFEDESGNNLLHYAFKENNFEFAKIIYALKPELIAQVNNSGQTPLSFANNPEGFKFIEKAINLENLKKRKREQEELEENTCEFQGQLIDLLKVDQLTGNNILHFAVVQNHIDFIKFLLDKKPSLMYQQNLMGRRPFEYSQNEAVKKIFSLKYLEFKNIYQDKLKRAIVSFNLEDVNKYAMFSFNASDKNLITPLMIAAGYRDYAVISSKNLINTEYNEESFKKKSIILFEMCNALIKSGARINDQDKNGNTALHHAIYYGYKEIVKLLLLNGADIKITNNLGKDALSYAKIFADGQVINLAKPFEIKEIINILENFKK